MLNKVKELMLAKRVNKILNRHSIEIAHYIPGRIRLRSTLWKHNPNTVGQLISHFKGESRIHSIQYTPETGSLLISYDSSPVDNVKELEQWVEQIERISVSVIQ